MDNEHPKTFEDAYPEEKTFKSEYLYSNFSKKRVDVVFKGSAVKYL